MCRSVDMFWTQSETLSGAHDQIYITGTSFEKADQTIEGCNAKRCVRFDIRLKVGVCGIKGCTAFIKLFDCPSPYCPSPHGLEWPLTGFEENRKHIEGEEQVGRAEERRITLQGLSWLDTTLSASLQRGVPLVSGKLLQLFCGPVPVLCVRAVYFAGIYNVWGVLVSELLSCQRDSQFSMLVTLPYGIFQFGLSFSLLQGFFWLRFASVEF